MKEALLEVPGVKDVQVNFREKKATAIVEKGKVKPADLIQALEKKGYPAKVAP